MTFKIGDQGQRYEVRAKNEVGKQVVIGWAETSEGVAALKKSVKLHPSFHSPKVIDRKKQGRE